MLNREGWIEWYILGVLIVVGFMLKNNEGQKAVYFAEIKYSSVIGTNKLVHIQ